MQHLTESLAIAIIHQHVDPAQKDVRAGRLLLDVLQLSNFYAVYGIDLGDDADGLGVGEGPQEARAAYLGDEHVGTFD